MGFISTFSWNITYSIFHTWKNNIWNLFLLSKKVIHQFGKSIWFFDIPITINFPSFLLLRNNYFFFFFYKTLYHLVNPRWLFCNNAWGKVSKNENSIVIGCLISYYPVLKYCSRKVHPLNFKTGSQLFSFYNKWSI